MYVNYKVGNYNTLSKLKYNLLQISCFKLFITYTYIYFDYNVYHMKNSRHHPSSIPTINYLIFEVNQHNI